MAQHIALALNENTDLYQKYVDIIAVGVFDDPVQAQQRADTAAAEKNATLKVGHAEYHGIVRAIHPGDITQISGLTVDGSKGS